MGAMVPLFLLAAGVVAVPVYLHLFQRQEARRLSFPALRYLERTEREHASRIRLRQMLLLLLRVVAVLLVVGAGARLFLPGPASDHPPTALAIVLDNSMSSGVIVGDERALDGLRRRALESVEHAGEDDRIWVIRAGEPWAPAVPVRRDEARRIIEEASPTAAAADLPAAVERAVGLVSTAPFPAAEVHLISDLQASAFPERTAAVPETAPIVVWAPERGDEIPNRALTRVLVGGGLPPLQGQRTEIAVEAAGTPGPDTSGFAVRVVLDERVRGAGTLHPGSSLVLPLPSAPSGWVVGYADADPDALRADDRRYFAYLVRPTPAVAVRGDPGIFVTQAIEVLAGAQRLRQTTAPTAEAVLAVAGEGLPRVGSEGSVLVIPPADPTGLPALNLRLQEAGIPWRAEPGVGRGVAELAGEALPAVLRGVGVRMAYRLALTGDPVTAPHTLATLDGDPWAVEGRTPSGTRYLLLASPLDAEATSLPVSSGMVAFVDWVTGTWAGRGSAATPTVAGQPLSAPRGADAVRLPSGASVPLDGTRMVHATGDPGFYAFLQGDSILAWEAVNPPPGESVLTPLAPGDLERVLGSGVVTVRDRDAWSRTIFRTRRGPEIWRVLLAAALLLLLVEGAMAASGRGERPRRVPSPPGAAHVRS